MDTGARASSHRTMGGSHSNPAGRLPDRMRYRSLALDLEAIDALALRTIHDDYNDLIVCAGNTMRNQIAVMQWNDRSLVGRLRNARQAVSMKSKHTSPWRALLSTRRVSRRVDFSKAIAEIPRVQVDTNMTEFVQSTCLLGACAVEQPVELVGQRCKHRNITPYHAQTWIADEDGIVVIEIDANYETSHGSHRGALLDFDGAFKSHKQADRIQRSLGVPQEQDCLVDRRRSNLSTSPALSAMSTRLSSPTTKISITSDEGYGYEQSNAEWRPAFIQNAIIRSESMHSNSLPQRVHGMQENVSKVGKRVCCDDAIVMSQDRHTVSRDSFHL